MTGTRKTKGAAALRAATEGMTDAEVAKELGRSQPAVNRWRNDDRIPDADSRDLIEARWPSVARHLWREVIADGSDEENPAA